LEREDPRFGHASTLTSFCRPSPPPFARPGRTHGSVQKTSGPASSRAAFGPLPACYARLMQQPDWLDGSCHCERVRFRVRSREQRALECNCSICSKKGFLHLIVEASDFELSAGSDCLQTYTFNTGVAKHHFCRHCGIHPFYRPRSHP